MLPADLISICCQLLKVSKTTFQEILKQVQDDTAFIMHSFF